jgi:hypothetical protein
MRALAAVATATLLFAVPTFADKKADMPRKIAVSYLKALDGTGNQKAREFLLGGLTLTAEEVGIPQWKLRDRVVQVEELDVQGAVQMMKALDKSGAKALNDIMNVAENTGEFGMASVDEATANKMMIPTQKAAKAFKAKYPVFAYCARAGKEIYWHPANPWREVIKQLGNRGKYKLEFHRFNVEENDGGKKRVWPLRVLRITAGDYDSGWKILPASDWDPDW